ncbi:UDP-N-acetylmuramoylalanine--D-glutamate ligase [plant metagenome]|uniref:UDP-N-acetylmuramoylalanine--D-glutamate ligase n=2 Tax=root TaxID=1 RepID=A0A1C3JWM6_9BURK|nr:UDP-N-acetylmuramoyl-L-alanine--D-glutamate ligase [Orrella dioscoreae]SBT23666.1 UDP-N-acetylmuramoylalanine--D-glutamate ligase [Orrella dioscoreae]SOE47616.1 UDP-N-acetylmuramoylalanine--D-glutamate ligase [Orrella dioscoreae]
MNQPAHLSAGTPRTLILGLGETGAAAARWCARQGQALRLADTREQPGGLEALRAALGEADVDVCLGASQMQAGLLDGVSQVVLSPGLAPHEQPVAAVLAQAAQRGIEVVGEIELFARALAALSAERGYAPRVLAVTGTNGKTTVTSLARHLIDGAGVPVLAAGNIGPAALAALAQALDDDALPEVWVLELSSFQLETTTSLAPDAAVVLNLSQDHLDWHGSMQAYAQAKARIYQQARVRVVNRDDAAVMAMVDGVQAKDVRSFGRDVPVLVGDMGLDRGHDVAWLAVAEATDFDEPVAPTPRRRKDAPPPARAEGRLVRMMPADALRLRGTHNALNVQAALLLARSLELPWGALLRAVRDYDGEPHRMRFVRSIQGVDFIDDSKGTNVGASVAGLEGLDQPVVLIAGGLGKGQDFSPLVPAVKARARAVVLIGQDAQRLAEALAPSGVPCQQAASMQDAVRQAMSLAQEGDAVLLSPACASMDMFRNYGHRGDVFAEEARELAMDRGEIA